MLALITMVKSILIKAHSESEARHLTDTPLYKTYKTDRVETSLRHPATMVDIPQYREIAKEIDFVKWLTILKDEAQSLKNNPLQIENEELMDYLMCNGFFYRDYSELLDMVQRTYDVLLRFDKIFQFNIGSCIICLDDNIKVLQKKEGCGDQYCGNCIKKYALQAVNDISQYTESGLPCPGCSAIFPEVLVEVVLGVEGMKQLNNNIMKIAARLNKDIYLCQNPLCEGAFNLEGPCRGEFICPLCKKTQCVFCNVLPFHIALSCKDYQRSLTKDGAEEFFKDLRETEKDKYKDCPSCATPIYKDFGCNDMHCMNCKQNFCWLCLSIIQDRTHFEGNEKCDLWKDKSVNPLTRNCPTATHTDERCLRCGSEQARELNCGHYFCDICIRHEQNNRPEDQRESGMCMQCFNEGKHKNNATISGAIAGAIPKNKTRVDNIPERHKQTPFPGATHASTSGIHANGLKQASGYNWLGAVTSVDAIRCQRCNEYLPIVTRNWHCQHSFCSECVIDMRLENHRTVCILCRRGASSTSPPIQPPGAGWDDGASSFSRVPKAPRNGFPGEFSANQRNQQAYGNTRQRTVRCAICEQFFTGELDLCETCSVKYP
ncbi:IBR domain-containing protein [Candidatus Sororendozoicomonas aggregata]|uniref:IBR domain-containing protein n=1 Tax=Candidatus Sororendozoicomonas aggregata TaxID=3073239 RepID=UPI002ED29A16